MSCIPNIINTLYIKWKITTFSSTIETVDLRNISGAKTG
jgi:hypothetical protein